MVLRDRKRREVVEAMTYAFQNTAITQALEVGARNACAIQVARPKRAAHAQFLNGFEIRGLLKHGSFCLLSALAGNILYHRWVVVSSRMGPQPTHGQPIGEWLCAANSQETRNEFRV
jgi:hypothetical protein